MSKRVEPYNGRLTRLIKLHIDREAARAIRMGEFPRWGERTASVAMGDGSRSQLAEDIRDAYIEDITTGQNIYHDIVMEALRTVSWDSIADDLIAQHERLMSGGDR